MRLASLFIDFRSLGKEEKREEWEKGKSWQP